MFFTRLDVCLSLDDNVQRSKLAFSRHSIAAIIDPTFLSPNNEPKMTIPGPIINGSIVYLSLAIALCAVVLVANLTGSMSKDNASYVDHHLLANLF